MRYLALDIGDKRTGLAVGDDETQIVTPLGCISEVDPRQRQIEIVRMIEKHGPQALVIGLPLNMDGTAGPAAEKMTQAADALADATGLPVHLMDERLSSAEADFQMSQSGLTRQAKKDRRDALAAATILRDFLQRKAME